MHMLCLNRGKIHINIMRVRMTIFVSNFKLVVQVTITQLFSQENEISLTQRADEAKLVRYALLAESNVKIVCHNNFHSWLREHVFLSPNAITLIVFNSRNRGMAQLFSYEYFLCS